jgi:hypothetical protein
VDNELYSSREMLEQIGITTERYSTDSSTNNNGECLIELCKNVDLKIVNGRVGHGEGIGYFTCHTPNENSVIDYAITSTSLLPLHFNVDVLDKYMSDVHSPLSITLRQYIYVTM